MKTIVKDRYLLTEEKIEDAQAEHDARHHAKLGGTREIQQTEVSSNPNAKKNFGKEQVQPHFTSHQKATAALCEAVDAKKDGTNQKDSSSAAAKAKANAKVSDKQQSGVEVDEDGFKIPQGAACHHRKKLEAAECQKITDSGLKSYLVPSDNLVNEV